MSDLSLLVDQLKQNWANVRVGLDANRAAWKASSPHLSLEQLDEVIATLSTWLVLVKPPKGFRPGFAMSRALALSSLPAAISACQGLGRSEYGQFNSLTAALTQAMGALHGMNIFAGKDGAAAIAAGLSADLAESLALTHTAQAEITSKQVRLESVEKVAAAIEQAREKVESSKVEVEEILEELSETKEKSTAAAEALSGREEKIATLEARHGELSEMANSLLKRLNVGSTELENLQLESKKQNDLIVALLPKGATAGLAASFAARVRSLEFTKWMWMVGFLLAIGGLIWVGNQVFGAPIPTGSTLLSEFGKRLPLLGPMIWLGWFSAIQYGNVLRVQEDYAFKEVTSKAFAGYRDYLATMQTIDLPGGHNALSMLTASTIEILAREPLRILNKSDQDVSPAQAILKTLKPGADAQE